MKLCPVEICGSQRAPEPWKFPPNRNTSLKSLDFPYGAEGTSAKFRFEPDDELPEVPDFLLPSRNDATAYKRTLCIHAQTAKPSFLASARCGRPEVMRLAGNIGNSTQGMPRSMLLDLKLESLRQRHHGALAFTQWGQARFDNPEVKFNL